MASGVVAKRRWVLAVVVIGGLCRLPAFSASFTDDFARTVVGNGWEETNSGNGNGPLPDAFVANGVVEFRRCGWGTNAISQIACPVEPSGMVGADFRIADVDDTSTITLAGEMSNGGYVRVQLSRDSASNATLRVSANPNNGTRTDWIACRTLGNIGAQWMTLRIRTDGTNSLTVCVPQAGYTETFSNYGFPAFTRLRVQAEWASRQSATALSADNLWAVPASAGTGLTILGLDGKSCPLGADNDTGTGITVAAETYTIWRFSNSPIVNIALHIQAAAPGSVIVNCGDIMPIEIGYVAGSQWYNVRIPWSTATAITATWPAAGAVWNEVILSERTPLPIRTGAGTKNVTVQLSSNTASQCRVPLGFNTQWWEHGLTDGLSVPETKAELIQRLGEAGVRGLRYSGGLAAYGYPPSTAAIPAFVAAMPSSLNNYGLNGSYGLWHLLDGVYGYATPEQFFQFCHDANLTAFYQINPGYWYDPAANVVRKTVGMDAQGDTSTDNYTPQQVAYVRSLVGLANTLGVDVVWEIGNEDYCWYSADRFAQLCKDFITGIRLSDPGAKISITGNSHSYDDLTWHYQLLPALYIKGVRSVTSCSLHEYLLGEGTWVNGEFVPLPWDTPQNIGNSMVAAWSLARSRERNFAADFNNALLGPTETDLTELNIWPQNLPAPEIEHSVGRALGQAEMVRNIQGDGVSIFFHDLVRNDRDQTWFSSLDYYRSNPAGHRYFWFPEGAASAITAHHGRGHICYNSNGICVSRHAAEGGALPYVYITVVNRTAGYNDVSVALNSVTINHSVSVDRQTFRAASPECSFFDYYRTTDTVPAPSGQTVTLESPPYSVVGLKVYLGN